MRSIIRGIKNLAVWLPVIWKDRNWDYSFLLGIIAKKLELMEKSFNSNSAMTKSAGRHAKEMRLARLLIKRILEDDYLSNALTRHYEVYPRRDFRDCFESIPDKPGWKMYVRKEPPKEQASWDRACKHSDRMEEQDYDMLFKVLRKRIRGWWD